MQVSSREYKQSLPLQTQRTTEHIQDGILYRDRSVKRVVQTATQAEKSMPGNLESHPSFGPQVEFGLVEYQTMGP